MQTTPFKTRIISILLCAVLLLGLMPTLVPHQVHAATDSQNNIVARADYFYNLTWTAQSTVYGWNYNYTFYAGSTYRVPYGQPINSGAYVGYYVSIDDFLTAANTAGSVFYTSRSTYDTTSSVYYATDCSAFVSWCWGVDRKTTYSIPQVSTYIGMATASNTSLLQLGDCLNSNDVGHVVLVTDLIYSGSTLTSIEITEQTPPQMKRSYYTPSELGSKYGTYYGIYRYSGTVPAAPDGSTNDDSGSSSGTTSQYYPACDSSCTTFYEGMSNIGIDCDWTLHQEIAAANGITDFSGTAEQNTTLLNLLIAGKLINPNYTGSSDDSSSSGTVTSGSNGYERGYTGGMAGTGEYKAFGLDVSSWQGSSLDFTRIKNAGYDYVILRAGTTNGKDTCFETYYTNAKAAGLDVGAYYYSYATSVSAVQTDMEDFLSYISGKKFEYPIYFDYEDSTQQALSASLSQQICLTAMDMLAAEGYLVGMYTGKYFSTQLPIDTICAKYELWIAHYLAVGDGSYDGTDDYTTYGPTYASQYGMYQFTDSVWINGYGPYDGDVSFKDYPTIVKTYGFNGYEAEVTEQTYFDKCTFYPSRVKIKVTTATNICSEPRSAKDTNTSENLEAVEVGATFTTTGLYQNTGNNIWYQVETSTGETGYIYAGRVEFVKKAYDDIQITDYAVPNAHVAGNYFLVTGTITATYNVITEARVYIYSGFGTSGTQMTGGSDTISNNKYVLDGSSIDDATAFGDLPVGTYTYVITAPFYSYYADINESVAKVSGTRTVKKAYFTVVSSAVDQSTCSHSNTETVVTEATCTDTGVSVTSCSICGLTTKNTLAKISHSYGSYTVTLAATCTTEGSKEKTCSVCGKVYTKAIAATGHSYSSTSCTEASTCTVCGESSGEPAGHSYSSVVTAPTCTASGYTTYTCSSCGDSYTSDTVAAIGHSCTSVVTAPECLKDGYTTHTCSDCGYSYRDSYVTASGHSWIAATCTEAMTCSVCGTTTGSSLGHSYKSVVTDSECLKDGYTTHTCTTCGYSYQDSYVTAPGHSWIAATCTEAMTCATCGATTGSALGHNYANGTCSTCGAEDPDYVEPVTVPTLSLVAPSLNFEDEIYYNVYYKSSDMTDVVEMGLITFDGYLAEGTIDDALEVIPGYVTSGSNFMSHTNGIPSMKLGDALYFRVYAKLSDGTYAYSATAGYHAVAYAKDILANSTNEKMKALVVAMLNYGAAAQVHFEYKTDALVNSFLTDEQKALVSEYSSDMVDGIVAADSSKTGNFKAVSGGYSALAPSVVFEGAFSINYYFTPAKTMDGELKLYYWKLDDYNAADVLTTENATGVVVMEETSVAGQYLGAVPEIAAKQIDQTVYVCGVYESDGVSYPTGVIAYSLAAYCQDRIANGSETMKAFATETVVYGYYAKDYFANL